MRRSTLRMTMLYDFFGELLSDKQRDYFDMYHNEDLSLAEIADKVGISRQGVLYTIRRAERNLLDLENKTGIIDKWFETRNELEVIEKGGETVHTVVKNYFQL